MGTGLKGSPSCETPEVKRERPRSRTTCMHAEAVRDRLLQVTCNRVSVITSSQSNGYSIVRVLSAVSHPRGHENRTQGKREKEVKHRSTHTQNAAQHHRARTYSQPPRNRHTLRRFLHRQQDTGLYNFLVGTPSMPGAFSPALREEERAHHLPHLYAEQRDVGRNTPGGTTSKQLSKPIPG